MRRMVCAAVASAGERGAPERVAMPGACNASFGASALRAQLLVSIRGAPRHTGDSAVLCRRQMLARAAGGRVGRGERSQRVYIATRNGARRAQARAGARQWQAARGA